MALKKDPRRCAAPASRRCSPTARRSCSGPSGAGKSTLVNLMVADAKAQIGEISQALNTGRHTTTATQWYWLDARAERALIDSPGFQEFGLRHIDAERLAALMPDVGAHATACRFYNCTHCTSPAAASSPRSSAARSPSRPTASTAIFSPSCSAEP